MKSQAELKKMYKDLKTESIKLKQTIEMQGQTIEMQGQTIEELKRSVTDLKRRLGQHDNFNTPPSMKKGSSTSGTKGDSGMPKYRQSKLSGKQNGTADSVPKPRGGQKNHKGVTNKPEPTEFVSISLFEVYFCLFVHSYNYQHDIYENKLRFASKIQLKRARKNVF